MTSASRCDRVFSVTIKKIPNNLNAALVFFCFIAMSALLVLTEAMPNPYLIVASLILFSALFLTNYSLYHEASHHKLHSDSKWNYILGAITGVVFLCPFSIFYVTHWNHHLRNRTDLEMFDLYYQDGPKIKTLVKWYGYLLGMWFWMIPPGAFLIAFGPSALRARLMRREMGLVNFEAGDARSFNLTRVRIETLLMIAYFSALVYFAGLSASVFLLFYMAGSIWWSTTQYVDHAYAPRDVLVGAYNLKASRWFSLVNLHREFDLNHHLYPEVSWIHLPELQSGKQKQVEEGKARKKFFNHYWSQWMGPRLAPEPGPKPVEGIVSDFNDIIS